MALSKMLGFRVAVDAFHDLAAGVAPGAVLSLWMLSSGARATLDPVVFAELARTWTWILVVLLLALVVLLVTGAIRLGHRAIGVEPDGLKARGRAALIEHAFFIPIFIGSAVAAFALLQG